MTPEEAELTQLGAAIAAAHLDGRAEDRDTLLDELVSNPRWADVFVYVAMVAASTSAGMRGTSPSAIVIGLPEQREGLFSELSITENWAAASGLIRGGLANDSAAMQRAGAQFDPPTAAASTFSVAIGALEDLANGSLKTAAE